MLRISGGLGVALTVLFAVGCSAVRLNIDQRDFRVGGTVRIELKNGSATSVGYNLCGMRLEQKSPGGWAAVKRLPRVECITVLRLLGAMKSANANYNLPGTLPPSRYRLCTRVESPIGTSKQLCTHPFRVAR